MNKFEEKAQLIKESVYNDFSNEIKDLLFKIGKVKKFNKDQLVYSKGDLCETFDIVFKGLLSSFSLSENRFENVMFNFTPNTFIGGNLLFAKKPVYPMSIYAQKDCIIFSLTKKEIEELLNFKEFSLFFIISISKNAQNLNRKIVKYTLNTLRENIIEYLEELQVIQRSDDLILPISKKELAIVFGVQRQSLFREMKKMSDEGIIQFKNKKIRLINKKKLNTQL